MKLKEFSPKAIHSILNSIARINIWTGAVRSSKTISSIIRLVELAASNRIPKDIKGVLVGKTIGTLEKNVLDSPELMKEGEIVTIIINAEDDMPLSVDMPASVVLEVTHTEPGIKGNTATNATKPATVESGAIVNVPLFINEGDKIKVETTKGTYQERIKE